MYKTIKLSKKSITVDMENLYLFQETGAYSHSYLITRDKIYPLTKTDYGIIEENFTMNDFIVSDVIKGFRVHKLTYKGPSYKYYEYHLTNRMDGLLDFEVIERETYYESFYNSLVEGNKFYSNCSIKNNDNELKKRILKGAIEYNNEKISNCQNDILNSESYIDNIKKQNSCYEDFINKLQTKTESEKIKNSDGE